MDNNSLLELESRLSALPALEERLQKLHDRIFQARAEVESLFEQYEKEELDVERIKKESFSTTLLKLIGRHESRVEKEMQEMIRAKARYDTASVRLEELESEASRLKERISELTRDKRTYQEKLDRREILIRNSLSSEVSQLYKKLNEEGEYLARQLTETEEALGAARRAYDTAHSAVKYLDDAEGWATWDVWFGKGLLSHMVKYDKIDKAQEVFERLNAQINQLRLELNDIDLEIALPPLAIDSTTRFFDFWFDNIFTDLKVRSQIREYQNHVRDLYDRIAGIINRLEAAKRDLNEKISNIGKQLEEIIISFEAGK